VQKIDSLQALIETYDLMIKNKNGQMNIAIDLINKLCGILERVDNDGAFLKYDDEFVNYVQEIVLRRKRQKMLQFIRKHLTIGMVDAITTTITVITLWMFFVVVFLHYKPR